MPEENLTAKITVDTSQVAGAVAKAKQELNKLKDKTVNVKVKVSASSSGGGKSSGGGNNTNLGALGKQAERASWGLSSVADSSKKAAKANERATATIGELAQTVRTLRSALERFRNALNDANKSAKAAVRHSKKAEASAKASEPEKSDAEKSAEEEKNAQKEALAANRANIKSVRNFAKTLTAAVAVVHLFREAYKRLEASLGTPAGYEAAGRITGMGSERIQQWKWALTEYGGGEAGGIADMLAIQRNLEAMGRGENPFGNAAMVNLGGKALAYRPGMTQEDFIDQIAPALQSLSLEKAMAAGRDLGLSESLIAFLHDKEKGGANWRKYVDQQNKTFSAGQTKKSAEAQAGYKQTAEKADAILNSTATALGEWLKNNQNIQYVIGAGGTVLGALREILLAVVAVKLAALAFGKGGAIGGAAAGWGLKGFFAKLFGGAAATAAAGKVAAGATTAAGGAAAGGTAAGGGMLGALQALFNAFAPATIGAMGGAQGIKRITDIGKAYGFFKPDSEAKMADGREVGDLTPLTVEDNDKPSVDAFKFQSPINSSEVLNKIKTPQDLFNLDAGEAQSLPNELFQQYLHPTVSNDELQQMIQNAKKPSVDAFNYPALPADTPLNHMDNASARQLGAAAGRGETSVDVGGVVININAPTGDAEDIQNAVARGTGGAAEIMRQQLEELDREFASPYYA